MLRMDVWIQEVQNSGKIVCKTRRFLLECGKCLRVRHCYVTCERRDAHGVVRLACERSSQGRSTSYVERYLSRLDLVGVHCECLCFYHDCIVFIPLSSLVGEPFLYCYCKVRGMLPFR